MSDLNVDEIRNSAGTGAVACPEGIVGRTDGAAAAAGEIGEVMRSFNDSSNLSYAGNPVVFSHTLSPGVWLLTFGGSHGGSGDGKIIMRAGGVVISGTERYTGATSETLAITTVVTVSATAAYDVQLVAGTAGKVLQAGNGVSGAVPDPDTSYEFTAVRIA